MGWSWAAARGVQERGHIVAVTRLQLVIIYFHRLLSIHVVKYSQNLFIVTVFIFCLYLNWILTRYIS